MSAKLFALQRLTAFVLACAVAIHLATILYAVQGGLTAGEISPAPAAISPFSPSTACS